MKKKISSQSTKEGYRSNERSNGRIQAEARIRRFENHAQDTLLALEELNKHAYEIGPVVQEYNKTSSDKTMALRLARNSSKRIQNRRSHQDMVEGLAVVIGQKLGLNTEVIRIMARNHDIGHIFWGHRSVNGGYQT